MMFRVPVCLSASCLLLLTLASLCLGHGTSHRRLEGGVGLEALYDDGSPMDYCEVEVYSPRDAETPFQQGSTDANGRFMFYPDLEGQWRIVVNDGMGHGLAEELSVGAVEEAGTGFHDALSRWQKVLIGVSIIFGLTGIASYLAARRQPCISQMDS